MNGTECPQLSLRRILTQCADIENSPEQKKYLDEKTIQLKFVHRQLDVSIHQLKLADDDSSDKDFKEEMQITGLEYCSPANRNYPRITTNHLRISSEYREMKGSSRQKSLPSQLNNKYESLQSQREIKSKRSPFSFRSKSQNHIDFPILFSKASKNKAPINASRSSQL